MLRTNTDAAERARDLAEAPRADIAAFARLTLVIKTRALPSRCELQVR